MSIETRTPDTGTTRPVSLPAAGRRPDLAVLVRPDSPEAEAYRALRASIKFAGDERPARSILLADAGAGDERATIAANVATALAAAGDATLLIDADLRHPAQHRIFGVDNDEGVSTYLRGRGDALLPLAPTAVPDLALLPAGPTPPDPAELLASDRLRRLLAQAREAAEFIIVDAPPVTAVADALAVAAAVDGVLLIVRSGRTRRTAAQRAKEQLLRVGANLLGVVLADAPVGRDAYRY
ncbi:MAG TPA: CpsD/CapB family tyrosine-protein kinase [Thermomicrobiales bacterium]|nr:CpsD/CapB family tyrosine-protein kinase [Thermomicrobiales bacterium]